LEYTVEVTDTALTDAENYFHFLQYDRQEYEYADRWCNGLLDALLSLESMPRRCPIIQKGRNEENSASSSINLIASSTT
jgi:hypothetical protein